AALLSRYVTALDQALAAHCAAQNPAAPSPAKSESSHLGELLDLCERETDNAAMRMLLLSTAEREARARPGVVKENRERLERLQRQYPLRQPAKGLTDAVLARIHAEP